MKRKLSAILMTLLILSNTVVAYGKEMTNFINTQYTSYGLVAVQYQAPTEKRVRLMVEKDGVRYTYNIQNKEVENFPLQMGSGEYVVRILENIEDNRYREVYKKTLQVEMKNDQQVYLNSIQEIKWDKDSKAIQKAAELTKGLKTDEEKIESIYNYIVTNISYDFDKFAGLTSLYLPNIDQTLESGQGICYDYASLLAAMLRSVGIPTKMVKGYAPNVREYHAWNQVYLESKGQWVTMDITTDAQMMANNQKVQKYKDASEFQVQREF